MKKQQNDNMQNKKNAKNCSNTKNCGNGSRHEKQSSREENE